MFQVLAGYVRGLEGEKELSKWYQSRTIGDVQTAAGEAERAQEDSPVPDATVEVCSTVRRTGCQWRYLPPQLPK